MRKDERKKEPHIANVGLCNVPLGSIQSSVTTAVRELSLSKILFIIKIIGHLGLDVFLNIADLFLCSISDKIKCFAFSVLLFESGSEAIPDNHIVTVKKKKENLKL